MCQTGLDQVRPCCPAAWPQTWPAVIKLIILILRASLHSTGQQPESQARQVSLKWDSAFMKFQADGTVWNLTTGLQQHPGRRRPYLQRIPAALAGLPSLRFPTVTSAAGREASVWSYFRAAKNVFKWFCCPRNVCRAFDVFVPRLVAGCATGLNSGNGM